MVTHLGPKPPVGLPWPTEIDLIHGFLQLLFIVNDDMAGFHMTVPETGEL